MNAEAGKAMTKDTHTIAHPIQPSAFRLQPSESAPSAHSGPVATPPTPPRVRAQPNAEL